MAETRRVGSHATWFEEPDVIALRLTGPVSLEESEVLARLHEDMARGREKVFMLVDMAEFGGGTPEGRKVTGAALSRMPVQGVAIHQAKMTARVMAKLVLTGTRLFRKGDGFPTEFFGEEAAARVWIEERRGAAVAR
ncbi:MAG TPA: STAS/SEC14 domain-containing protein [Thermoanaerobaculia bacterium]|nr:STAS/SEC14 domain-containing protein [Thermoanaerobaculia bacterium]